MSDPLVRIQAVTKTFAKNGSPALADLTAQIEPGRVTGLVGPDGAGKTTLLRLLAGLLLPDQGCISVCGYDTRSEARAIRAVSAYLAARWGL